MTGCEPVTSCSQSKRSASLSYIERWSCHPDLNRDHDVPNVVLYQVELWPDDGGKSRSWTYTARKRRVYSALGSPVPDAFPDNPQRTNRMLCQ